MKFTKPGDHFLARPVYPFLHRPCGDLGEGAELGEEARAVAAVRLATLLRGQLRRLLAAVEPVDAALPTGGRVEYGRRH